MTRDSLCGKGIQCVTSQPFSALRWHFVTHTLCVCVCVCVCACVRACVRGCVCACVHTCMFVCILHSYAWTLVDVYIKHVSVSVKLLITSSISMYATCVILHLFSILSHLVDTLHIFIIIIIIINQMSKPTWWHSEALNSATKSTSFVQMLMHINQTQSCF